MAMPQQLVIVAGIKVLVVLLTIAVLILLDPTYVTAYISINYEIVIIYIVSALTLLYCLVSVIMYFVMCRGRDEEISLTNCAIAEVVLSTAGIMGWLIILGIGGTISQRTIIETGERFGWIGALAGINTACFLGIAGLFCLNVINEKILAPRNNKRGYRQGPPQY